MKKTNLTLPIIALIAGTISPSYGHEQVTKYVTAREYLPEVSNDVVDVTEDLKEIHKNLISEVQNFKKKAEIRINGNEKVFAVFKVKILKINIKDRATYQKMVSKFEQDNADLKNKLVNYKYDQVPIRWKSFKKAFEHDLDILELQMWSVN